MCFSDEVLTEGAAEEAERVLAVDRVFVTVVGATVDPTVFADVGNTAVVLLLVLVFFTFFFFIFISASAVVIAVIIKLVMLSTSSSESLSTSVSGSVPCSSAVR